MIRRESDWLRVIANIKNGGEDKWQEKDETF